MSECSLALQVATCPSRLVGGLYLLLDALHRGAIPSWISDLGHKPASYTRWNLAPSILYIKPRAAHACLYPSIRVCPTFYTWSFSPGCAAPDANHDSRTSYCN